MVLEPPTADPEETPPEPNPETPDTSEPNQAAPDTSEPAPSNAEEARARPCPRLTRRANVAQHPHARHLVSPVRSRVSDVVGRDARCLLGCGGGGGGRTVFSDP